MPADAAPDRPHVAWWVGLGIGAVSTVAALLASGPSDLPYGFAFVDLGLAVGVASVIVLLVGLDRCPGDASTTLALAPQLVVVVLVRLLVETHGAALAYGLTSTIVLHAVWVSGAAGLLAVAHGQGRGVLGARALAWGGWATAFGLAVWLAAAGRPWIDGGALVLAVTGVTVLILVMVQAVVATRVKAGRIAVLASAPALIVAAGQLLDGVVSWLAVGDPFGWLGGGFSEDVALSAILIHRTGIGYPVVKWILAVGAVGAIEAGTHDGTRQGAAGKVLLYLLVVLLGWGPGSFSTSRLFTP